MDSPSEPGTLVSISASFGCGEASPFGDLGVAFHMATGATLFTLPTNLDPVANVCFLSKIKTHKITNLDLVGKIMEHSGPCSDWREKDTS